MLLLRCHHEIIIDKNHCVCLGLANTKVEYRFFVVVEITHLLTERKRGRDIKREKDRGRSPNTAVVSSRKNKQNRISSPANRNRNVHTTTAHSRREREKGRHIHNEDNDDDDEEEEKNQKSITQYLDTIQRDRLTETKYIHAHISHHICISQTINLSTSHGQEFLNWKIKIKQIYMYEHKNTIEMVKLSSLNEEQKNTFFLS